MVTVAQAADILGIGRDAVWSRIKRGTLPKVDGIVGPSGEVYVDISDALGRGKRRPRRSDARPTAPTEPTERSAPTERMAPAPSAELIAPNEPTEPTEPTERTNRTTERTDAPAVDERDIRIASLEAEREGLSHLLAFTKDELLIVREEHTLERERDREAYARELEAVRSDHAAAIANYQRTIDDLTAAVGGQADTIRALQARVVLPQLVAGDQTGNAPEGPLEALQRTDPPFMTDKTLKRGFSVAAALDALKFWDR